jgi:hypothetical protein
MVKKMRRHIIFASGAAKERSVGAVKEEEREAGSGSVGMPGKSQGK